MRDRTLNVVDNQLLFPKKGFNCEHCRVRTTCSKSMNEARELCIEFFHIMQLLLLTEEGPRSACGPMAAGNHGHLHHKRQPESEAAVKFAALLGRVVNVQRWIKGVGGGNVDGEEVDHQARAGRL
ncbi:hypothetical protein A0H81_10991 [Grifola frondosa]|uniref:Uncharacterized protein n=1 Tax=Grifola frondosa TaxID=5627 RepID=A0A1C7LVQ4_GRIFR|nr:hypothetical protein A0H81_10991 [Grifola frondosa]